MVRVLVLGATGYLGNNVALALRRAGHRVWGLVRSEAKSVQLARAEITPVVGSLKDNAVPHLVESENIDVVVDASGVNQEGAQTVGMLIKLGTERLDRHRENPHAVSRLAYIYISGMWIHGSSFKAVNELNLVGTSQSIAQPPAMLSWRPAVEQSILAARSELNGIIVRPALMYGQSQSAWGMYFGAILQAKGAGGTTVGLPANASTMTGLVHVEDVASGVSGVVSHLDVIGSGSVLPIFDLTSSYESLTAILAQAAVLIGFKNKIEYTSVEGEYLAEAMNTVVNGDSQRAKALFGWSPRHVSMAADLDIHVAAFLASQTK